MLTRFFAAVGILAMEMQMVTWLSVATLRSLFFVNAAIAVVAVALFARRGRTLHLDLPFKPFPMAAVGALALLVLVLNVTLPLEAADPYHLERVFGIERSGTLAYDLMNPDPKVNVLGWTYELLLADVHQIPLVGRALVRTHGLFGLALYVLAIASARTWIRGGRPWCRTAVFVVPVMFHQLVLVKNDLYGAVPAIVVLAWLVARAPAAASTREIAWAAWLAGFAVAVKMTSAPVAAVLAGTLLWERKNRTDVLKALLLGGLAGAACGGLFFTWIENARWYGHPLAPHEAGGPYNQNVTVTQMAIGIVRFTISLFDLGYVTRTLWQGRGGWGSIFGLPLIWALAVLAIRYRTSVEARRAVSIAGVYFLLFAIVYTDADIAHRLVLAPGVLLILVAISLSDGSDAMSRRLRAALAVVMAASALQIARSAALYFERLA